MSDDVMQRSGTEESATSTNTDMTPLELPISSHGHQHTKGPSGLTKADFEQALTKGASAKPSKRAPRSP